MGCRERDRWSVLLRVVVAEDGGYASAVPDPGHRSAGRGAWVHPRPACLDAAERRRAFPRALRHAGPLDLADLRAYLVAVRCSPVGATPVRERPASTVETESGSDSDEHPMSSQQ
ncbi:MAG TPA: YlxR family protein [Kineosporiaceae bacterium]